MGGESEEDEMWTLHHGAQAGDGVQGFVFGDDWRLAGRWISCRWRGCFRSGRPQKGAASDREQAERGSRVRPTAAASC